MISRKNILLISTFISIIITVVFAAYLYSSILPLSLNLKSEKKVTESDNQYFVYDYDRDGNCEWFEIANKHNSKRAVILFSSSEDVFNEEFSVRGRTELRWIHFDDINDDNKDDLILFSSENDSLFLTLIDLNTQNYIQKEQFLITREKNNNLFWDLACFYIGKIENELLLFTGAGYSLTPRVFLKYDLKLKKITDEFFVASCFTEFEIIDLNNDGIEEIVAIGGGTGNRPDEKFSDMTSWVFVLDTDFNFVVPPKNFGRYPQSGLEFSMLTNMDNKYLLLARTFSNSIGKKIKLILLDRGLNTIRQIDESGNAAHIRSIEKNGDLYSIVTTNAGNIKLYNSSLNLVNEKTIDHYDIFSIYLSDYNMDGKKDIFLISSNFLLLYSENFEPLLEFELPETPFLEKNHITINYDSKKISDGVVINFPSGTKYYTIEDSLNYRFLPLYLFIIFAALFALITFSMKGYNVYQIHNKRRTQILNDYAYAIYDIDGNLVQKTDKFRLIANVKTFEELLNVLGIESEVNQFIQSLREKRPLKFTVTGNEFRITLIDDERPFHQPIIYVFIEPHQPKNGNNFAVWSKSIQKIAHDIKTPISSLLLNLKAVGLRVSKSDFEEKEEIISDIEAMKHELNRINNLTRGFLRFTNIEEPKLRITNLFEIIQSVARSFSHYTSNGIEIDINVDKQIYLNVDDFQLREVFQVLIENSIEAMNHNGTININAEEIDGFENSEQSEILISVTDNGEGIHPDILGKIFDTKFTSKPHGNGLGLPIAKRIVEMHKGRIEVYSKERIGTTFKIILPLNK